MIKHIVICVVLALLICIFSSSIKAQEVKRANNIFGIHVATPSREELENAAKLVNSSGGAWGYVTVVIQENDRDLRTWQEAFDQMRELRLIPIVRIATQPIENYWKRPTTGDIPEWVTFLNKLPWVVKDRYVILFNEPNHALEWGGTLDPQSFADITYEFAKKLKEANGDFFIMLAGMDAAAPQSPPNYLDEAYYLSQAFEKQPELARYIDGLSSHSYPNPGFAGSPYSSGRNTITSYTWELSLLKSLGVEKELPVFITETGWRHNGVGVGSMSPVEVGSSLTVAYDRWQEDPRVVAATPFILNYQGEPFLSFSFQKFNERDFYDHFYTVQDTPKVHGAPIQHQSGTLTVDLPNELLTHSTYRFPLRLINRGQAVWDRDDEYELRMIGYDANSLDHFFADIKSVKPHEETDIDLYVKTSGTAQAPSTAHISLYRGGEEVLGGGDWRFSVLPPPTLQFKVSLFPRIRAKKDREFEIQIFDSREQIVYKKKGLKRVDGQGSVGEIQNIYLNGKYRIVILSPYYLPRQTFVRFQKGANIVSFRPMLPLDFNRDGAFNGWDLLEIFKNPRVLGLFLP